MIELWNNHGTKILGTAQALLSAWLLIPDLFSPGWLKWAHAVNAALGVFTVQRGISNSRAGQ